MIGRRHAGPSRSLTATVNQRQIDVVTSLCLLCLASISGRWRFEATLRFWYCCAMANCKLLAFLLCNKANVDQYGRVTLRDLFDGIVIPQSSRTRHFPSF